MKIAFFLFICFVMLYGKTNNLLDVLTIPNELKDCNATHNENYSKELNSSLGCLAQDKILDGDFNGDGKKDSIFIFSVIPNLNSDQDLMLFQRYRLLLLKVSSTKGHYNYIKLNDNFAPYDYGYQNYIFNIQATNTKLIVLIEGGSGFMYFKYRFTFKKLMLCKIHYDVSYSRINPQKCIADKTVNIEPKSIQNIELLKYINKYNFSLPQECYRLVPE
jgi:hypothetical protein